MPRAKLCSALLALGVWVLLAASGVPAAERKEVRVLYDFENPAEAAELGKNAENLALDIVQDKGVTSGKNCCRLSAKQGAEFSVFLITGEKAKGWDNFDYFAMDVFVERTEQFKFVVELWDNASVNYATRCTFEEGKLHAGANSFMVRIDRAKRNNKEGSEWEELEAKDKIDRANLKMVKIFFAPFKTGDTVLWVDNIRLLQEDAAGGKLQIALPPGAKAYAFGKKAYTTPGFEWIGLEEPRPGVTDKSLRSVKDVIGVGMSETGKGWPDQLTGNGVACVSGDFTFTAQVPNGDYWVWLSAGKLFSPETRSLAHLLKVGGQVLCDEKLSEKEFYGDKGIFRHLRTQYSQRPNALWLDYVEPEAPEFTLKVTVKDGTLPVQVSNHRLSALVVVPAQEEAAFKKMCADIREQRIKYFYSNIYLETHAAPKPQAGDGAYVLWAPKASNAVRPWTAAEAAEQAAAKLDAAGARGQRVVLRLCVTAYQDLGQGDIELSDLKGPGTIPASACRRYYQNYRVQDSGVDEMALLPWTKIRFEPGMTWAYWLWLKIPEDAAGGAYTGSLTFKPGQGESKTLPVALEVYPFTLDDKLPGCFGMYYGPWDFTPSGEGGVKPIDFRIKLTKEQFQFMREIGFNSTTLPSPFIMEGNLRTERAQPFWTAAKEFGFGRQPDQPLLSNQLGLARRISRDMFMDQDAALGFNYVDRHPGIEFTLPGFHNAYLPVLRQYHSWIQSFGMPVTIEVVDEPREMPNPWNRRRDEAIRYADWLHEAGFKTFVTFMGDTNQGKDYTPLVDHTDVVSVHAYEASAKLIARAAELNKALWIYNTGMDRFSWGFYNWRMNSKGRWEWHFCSPEGGSVDGFPNPQEWYTPFTNSNAYTLHAPYYDLPGGMLFKSVYFGPAEGITDSAYIHTLERAIEAAKADPAKGKAAEEAMAFLAAVKRAIPQFAKVKGLASADAGALVGAGLDTPVGDMAEPWRRKIAQFLVQLAK